MAQMSFLARFAKEIRPRIPRINVRRVSLLSGSCDSPSNGGMHGRVGTVLYSVLCCAVQVGTLACAGTALYSGGQYLTGSAVE